MPAADTAHLRSGAEMARRFARWPGAVERSVALADELVKRRVAGGVAGGSQPPADGGPTALRLTLRGEGTFAP